MTALTRIRWNDDLVSEGGFLRLVQAPAERYAGQEPPWVAEVRVQMRLAGGNGPGWISVARVAPGTASGAPGPLEHALTQAERCAQYLALSCP